MRKSMKVGQVTKQKGFTLIEVMIALGIGFLVYALVTGTGNTATAKGDQSAEVTNMTNLFTQLRTLRSTSGYGTAGTDLVSQLKATSSLPTGMSVDSSGLIYNNWSGNVTAVSTGLGWKVSSPNVPSDMCIKVAVAVSNGNNVLQTQINGGSVITGAVDVNTAKSACATGTATLVWTSPN